MTHINLRRDTAANWTSANPVLQLGETGWERDTRKVKQGDGETAWNDLPYIVEPSVTSVNGQVGVVVLDKGDIGLANVDNTPDTDKPVSTLQQAALDTKAGLASPVFTGNPTAPTAASDDSDTTIATTAYVQNELADYADDLVVMTNKDLTDDTNEFPVALARVLATQADTTEIPEIDSSGPWTVLAPAFDEIDGALYRVIAYLELSNDTAGAYSVVNLLRVGGGGPSTEFAECVKDHRVANRREGVMIMGLFTGDPGIYGSAKVFSVDVIAGSGETTVHGDQSPSVVTVERIG